MSQIKYRDLLGQLSNDEAQRMLRLIQKRRPELISSVGKHYISNISRLVNVMNDIGYRPPKSGPTYKSLKDHLYGRHGPPRPTTEDRRPPPKALMPYETESFVELLNEDPEGAKQLLDEMNATYERQQAMLRDNRKRDDEVLMRRRRVVDAASTGLMDTSRPTIEDKDELQRITDGLLDGNTVDVNKELTQFLNAHGYVHIDTFDSDGDAILLTTPIDMQLFREALPRTGYRPNEVRVDRHTTHTNYYLNRCDNVARIRGLLEDIYDHHRGRPFKIGFDVGYIKENTQPRSTTEDRRPPVSYTRTYPHESQLGRTIPCVIESREQMHTYWHYVYAVMSERTEEHHETSSIRYCAIHTFMFQVTPMGTAGASIKIAGYEYMEKKRSKRVMPDEKYLCMLCAVADFIDADTT
jgi:hypothetical protein